MRCMVTYLRNGNLGSSGGVRADEETSMESFLPATATVFEGIIPHDYENRRVA